MANKTIATIMLLTIIMVPNTFAFSLFGIDFGAVWDKITFWDNDDTESVSAQQPQQVTSTNTYQATNRPQVKITLAGKEYTEASLKAGINNNEEIKGYIKGFGYDCIFVETDKGTNFTLKFNTEAGTLNSLRLGNSCSEHEIYLEESLITDITENGFSTKNIKTYLEKVDLPVTMYAKAVKVFTVG